MRNGWVGSDVWDKVPNKSGFFTPSLMMIIHKGCTKNIRYNCLKRYDEHWRPVSVQCSLCNFPFTHILHFESLQVGDQSVGVEPLMLMLVISWSWYLCHNVPQSQPGRGKVSSKGSGQAGG